MPCHLPVHRVAVIFFGHAGTSIDAGLGRGHDGDVVTTRFIARGLAA
jgi:hypothetical protein